MEQKSFSKLLNNSLYLSNSYFFYLEPPVKMSFLSYDKFGCNELHYTVYIKCNRNTIREKLKKNKKINDVGKKYKDFERTID